MRSFCAASMKPSRFSARPSRVVFFMNNVLCGIPALFTTDRADEYRFAGLVYVIENAKLIDAQLPDRRLVIKIRFDIQRFPVSRLCSRLMDQLYFNLVHDSP